MLQIWTDIKKRLRPSPRQDDPLPTLEYGDGATGKSVNALNAALGKMETLTCTRCGKDWVRYVKRGAKPIKCEECRAWRPAPRSLKGAERSEAMRAMYFEDHQTLETIGDYFGITRERVRQVLKKDHGLKSGAGFQMVRLRTEMRHATDPAPTCKKCGAPKPTSAQAWKAHRATHVAQYGSRMTPEQNVVRRQIADEYVAGVLTQDIMDRYHISGPTLTQIRIQFDVPSRYPNMGRKLNAPEAAARKQAIIADARAKTPRKDIAAKHGCSPSLVYLFAKEAGLVPVKPRLKVTPEIVEEWQRRYAAGETQMDLAREFKTTGGTVWRYIHNRHFHRE